MRIRMRVWTRVCVQVCVNLRIAFCARARVSLQQREFVSLRLVRYRMCVCACISSVESQKGVIAVQRCFV